MKFCFATILKAEIHVGSVCYLKRKKQYHLRSLLSICIVIGIDEEEIHSILPPPQPETWIPEQEHFLLCVCAHLCLTLCNPMDCSPPGSSVRGFLHAGIVKWVAVPFSRGSSWPGDWTHVSCVSCIGRWVLFYSNHLGSPTFYLEMFKHYENRVSCEGESTLRGRNEESDREWCREKVSFVLWS